MNNNLQRSNASTLVTICFSLIVNVSTFNPFVMIITMTLSNAVTVMSPSRTSSVNGISMLSKKSIVKLLLSLCLVTEELNVPLLPLQLLTL